MRIRLDKLDTFPILLLTLLSGLMLYPALSSPFIILDDPFYVTANLPIQDGLTTSSIAWAFKTFYYGNWAPLTWLYHMLDYELFGLKPWGHHLTSLILHIASSLLFYFLLKRFGLSLTQSFLAAAIFAIHPLHVEPVVWVSSHKDILSGVFFFATLHLYLNYVWADRKKRPQSIVALRDKWEIPVGSQYLATGSFCGLSLTRLGNITLSRICRWAALHLSFLLGLMAKSVLVTLPVLLLFLDYWPLKRQESKTRLLLEKLPLFALSYIFVLLTKYGQGILGATSYDFLSLPRRLGNACYYLARYVYNFIWPFDLAIQYQHPFATLPAQFILLCVILIFVLSMYALSQLKKHPAIFISWLWFLLLIAPYLQITQVGNQAMSDRWMYLPLAGLAIFLVSVAKRALYLVFALVIFFSFLSREQLNYWKTPGGIFVKSLEVDEENSLANLYLGLSAEGDRNAEIMSLSYYKRVLALNPNSEIAFQNVAQRLRGIDKEKHLFLFTKHLGRFKEGSASAHIQQGKILKVLADYQEAADLFKKRFGISAKRLAIKHFEQALLAYPSHAVVHADLAQVLLSLGKTAKAEEHFILAEKYSPKSVPVLNALGMYYLKLGKNDLALSKFLLGIETNPNSTDLRVNLGNVYLAKKQFVEAKKQYGMAIRLVELKKEKNIIPYLGMVEVCVREGDNLSAFNFLAYAFDMEPNDPQVLNRLAGIYFKSKQELEALRILNYALGSKSILNRATEELKISMIFNSGLAFKNLGQLHRARERMQWLLAIDPKYQPAKSLLIDLEKEIASESS